MYYKNRGSARIMLAGGGLLGLLVVVVIMSYLGGESAKTAVKTGQDIKKTIKEKIQKPLDEQGRRINKMTEGSFDVILEDVGPHEEDVIKAVRSLKKVGLKEARDIVRSEDGTVLTDMTKAEAQNAKRQLEQAGATVTIDKRRD